MFNLPPPRHIPTLPEERTWSGHARSAALRQKLLSHRRVIINISSR